MLPSRLLYNLFLLSFLSNFKKCAFIFCAEAFRVAVCMCRRARKCIFARFSAYFLPFSYYCFYRQAMVELSDFQRQEKVGEGMF